MFAHPRTDAHQWVTPVACILLLLVALLWLLMSTLRHTASSTAASLVVAPNTACDAITVEPRPLPVMHEVLIEPLCLQLFSDFQNINPPVWASMLQHCRTIDAVIGSRGASFQLYDILVDSQRTCLNDLQSLLLSIDDRDVSNDLQLRILQLRVVCQKILENYINYRLSALPINTTGNHQSYAYVNHHRLDPQPVAPEQLHAVHSGGTDTATTFDWFN